MDTVRDLIEQTEGPITTDYWRVRTRTQEQLWNEGIALKNEAREFEEDTTDQAYSGGKWANMYEDQIPGSS